MNRPESEDQVVPRHQQECRFDSDTGGHVLPSASDAHREYARSLLQPSRIIREALSERESLVDILTVTPKHMATVRNEALQQTQL